jgi:uncharacterized protein (TIGR03435 family)
MRAVLLLAGITAFLAGASEDPALRALQAPATSGAATEFDAASIKPTGINRPVNSIEATFWNAMDEPINDKPAPSQPRLRLRAIPVIKLIQLAYNVKNFQIQGGPAWVGSERYDVEATVAGQATIDQMRPMMRALLADRFKLTVRHEKRELPIYELVAARGGLKIAPMKEGECITFDPAAPDPRVVPGGPLNICGGWRRKIVSFAPERVENIEAVGVTMSKLIEMLSQDLGREMVDRTGFTEKFNFRLNFSPSVATVDTPRPVPGPEPGIVNAPVSAPSLSDALEEQLGVRLRSATGPADVLVISGVERPSAN